MNQPFRWNDFFEGEILVEKSSFLLKDLEQSVSACNNVPYQRISQHRNESYREAALRHARFELT